ncbi:MAG: M28 family peptidase [Chitinophagales bacterium]|nr:M28 family peptidase [Chitinophagales bacterium]
MDKHLMNWKTKIALFVFGLILLSCNNKNNQMTIEEPQDVAKVVERPAFSADSAYAYIEKQVSFGSRVPGTDEHYQCSLWLIETLERLGAKVQVQSTQFTTSDGKILPCYNIIGSFNEEVKERKLLASHWDSRPWADQDTANQDLPILGANDGASGVGVILEIARQIQASATKDQGLDIIFFDVEDYGISNVTDSYCLGSQYWSKHPHRPNYFAYKAILLDMVGAKNAVFAKENNSIIINSALISEMWNTAKQLGYGKYFVNKKGGSILDDHVYVYKYTRIPMIDIIHYDPTTLSGFGDFWHTHADNMDIIDKNTLQAVGETVFATILKD